ncbi:mitochondrial ribosomal protein L50 [Rhynchophorus ferrugineus]|uniref:mitochondrial ribosomal protein L50 n=1 Tax=Rhynchophorus ferrugineus TaxID=354439 RepID=UPI003FCC5144
MAAFFKHGILKTGQVLAPKNVFRRCYATKAEKRKGLDRKPSPKLNSTAQSLSAKGFLRPRKEYIPPTDLDNLLQKLFQETLGNTNLDTRLINLDERYRVFTACYEAFNHSVPNSHLHQIETLKDIRDFYSTPVDTGTPLDKMRTMELPSNLHVQFEYTRWNPKTDIEFGGITAFPESSTIVTGLKYKGKYKGHRQSTKHPKI